MFSDKLMGDGVLHQADKRGNLYAPVDGKVASIFDTKAMPWDCIRQWSREVLHLYIGNGYGRIKQEGFDLDISVGDEASRR